MKKKYGLLLFAIFLGNTLFGQISTRENTTSIFHTGTRPLAGSYGVYVGPSLMELMDMADENITSTGLPLINIKYYKTDQIEWRLGLQFCGKSKSLTGTTASSGSSNDIESNSFNRISLGGAYHFTDKNLLDVYVGAFLPLGWDTYKYENSVGSTSYTTSKFSPVFGLGAYIGLQAFVADLPLSIGLEYGLRAIGRTGKQYKHVEINSSGLSQTYYTEYESGYIRYSELKYSNSEFGTDVRFTLSYYFNK